MYVSFGNFLSPCINGTIYTQAFAVYHIFGFGSGNVKFLLESLRDISEKPVIIPAPACIIIFIRVNDIADKFEFI